MGTAVIWSYVREYGCEGLRSVSFIDQSPRLLSEPGWAFYRPVLRKVTVPALLINGAQSKIFPGDVAGWLAGALPNAEIPRFEGSGHAPFAEEPDRFNAVLAGFLKT